MLAIFAILLIGLPIAYLLTKFCVFLLMVTSAVLWQFATDAYKLLRVVFSVFGLKMPKYTAKQHL